MCLYQVSDFASAVIQFLTILSEEVYILYIYVAIATYS